MGQIERDLPYIPPNFKFLGDGAPITRGMGGSYTEPGEVGRRVSIKWTEAGFTGINGYQGCPNFSPTYDNAAVEAWVNALDGGPFGELFSALFPTCSKFV